MISQTIYKITPVTYCHLNVKQLCLNNTNSQFTLNKGNIFITNEIASTNIHIANTKRVGR